MTDQKQFDITWIDHEREPRVAPNPNFPNGRDIDASNGQPSCEVSLPYPARRCGMYIVHCKQCNELSAVTTAGRPDDPRSVKFACRLKVN